MFSPDVFSEFVLKRHKSRFSLKKQSKHGDVLIPVNAYYVPINITFMLLFHILNM